MSETKEPIENLWYLEDVTTLPKENTYVIDVKGKEYKLEYKNDNWVATAADGQTYTVTKSGTDYSFSGLYDGITSTYDVSTIGVRREGEGTGYYQDPDPRISYNIDELTRQAEINKNNGQTITDFRIYTKDDPTQPQTLRITYDENGSPKYSVIDHQGNSTTSTREELSELGITVSDTNNRYYPGGDPYAGTYVDKDGNPVNVLKKKNADGTYSDDEYEIYGGGNDGKTVSKGDMDSTTSGLTRDDRSAIRNGPGSSDQADIYDSEMHHHHVTKKITLSDITELNNQDISSYYKDKGTYNVGDRYTMGTDGKVTSSGSRLDFILDLAHTNQWSVKDAIAYVDGYDNDGDKVVDPGLVGQGRLTFTNNNGKTFDSAKGHYDYWNSNPVYSKWLSDLSDANQAKGQADNLRNSVADLQGNFKTVMDKLEGFCGEASDAARDVIECILGKFAVTMANIENALEPACEAIMDLVQALTDLKDYNQQLQDKLVERDRLQTELDALKQAEQAALITYNKTPDTITVEDGTDENGNTKYKTVHNPEKDTAKAAYDAAVKAREAKEQELETKVQEIEELMVILDELTLKVESYIQLFENLQTSVKTFGSIVDQVGGYSSADEVIAHHDQILEKFESYELMPVITNLTDYSVGDIVMFDDSYGTLYKVTGLDLESGRITIVAVDENGNVIGEPIEIWDPREIAPPRGLSTEGKPDDKPKPGPVVKPTNGPGPGPGPTPGPDTDPPPGPGPTQPPKTNPTTPPRTNPTTPTTPPRTNPTTPPMTNPPTYPYTEYVPYPVEDPDIPTIPITGINSTTTSVKSSGLTGLGALAGLAAGAAGIGAAALAEKDEEEETSEEKKEENKSE